MTISEKYSFEDPRNALSKHHNVRLNTTHGGFTAIQMFCLTIDHTP